jgi:hypothetical protein
MTRYTITPRPQHRDVLMQREGSATMRDPGDQLRAMLAAAMERPAPKPLTRRERAAMQLALAIIRESVTEYGPGYRWIDGYVCAVVSSADHTLRLGQFLPLNDALFGSCCGTAPRLVRARLALYLRARLRADAGDCGRTTPIPLPAKCRHWMHEQDSDGRCGYLRCGCWTWTHRITPLWQSAPETRR